MGIMFITITSLIAAISAYFYNLYPHSPADNGRFYVPLIIGLQIVNVYSDIHLCAQILNQSSFNNHVLILISGVGVLIFIILSYLINIIFAARRNFKSIIRINIACKYYFDSKRHYILFFVIMICTGSSWCSLLLLSSRIFAIELLNNGLTMYELMGLLVGKNKFASYAIFSCLPQIA